jgi:hypothetical protein
LIGTTLAQFRFTAKLGEGGMGEVYRAEDTRLGREVAIKVLPSEVKHDADRLSRFEREARILASLNHPNIAGLLQIEDIEDRTLLVMELVEGEDVADRLARGPIPVIHAIELARQIATGLEVAHERGIVHRDLKPANVKVSADDQVKILDFGLAKIWESVGEGSPVLTDSPTMTAQMTRAGVVLGTAAYMSPEQARGDAADQRSDIWSFGTVLYEMLTGERLFLEPTASDTLASVLRSDIDWGKLPGECPPGLRRLLRRCLEREPRRRYHAVADVRLDLEDIAAGSGGVGITETMSVVSWKGLAIAAGLGAVLASLIAMIAVGFIPSSPSSAPGMRSFEVVRGVGVNPSSVYSGLNRLEPRVSPDGSMVLYPADGRLWIRDIARLEPRPLEGTDGTLDAFWSPDSASIAYVVGNELRRMSAQGGPGIVLTRLDSFYVGGCWGTGDRIVISLAALGLFEIPARGGDPQLILAPDRDNGDFDFHAPTFLGDSETIAFTLHPQNLVIDTVEVFDGHERKVVYKAPDGSQLTGVGFDPISSHLLVATVEANAGLWAIPLDLSTGAARGDPRLVVPDGLAPSATADGTLVFVDGLDFAPERLVRVDRAGKVIGEVGQALWDIRLPVASPDGKRVATRARHRGPGDLWVHDVDRETALRSGAVRVISGGFQPTRLKRPRPWWQHRRTRFSRQSHRTASCWRIPPTSPARRRSISGQSRPGPATGCRAEAVSWPSGIVAVTSFSTSRDRR